MGFYLDSSMASEKTYALAVCEQRRGDPAAVAGLAAMKFSPGFASRLPVVQFLRILGVWSPAPKWEGLHRPAFILKLNQLEYRKLLYRKN